ncbi:MAG: MarR family transcriptional regulator [Actinomycetota bacterium]
MATVSSVDIETRRRVGRAWRQIRRGASALRIKDLFYGGDDAPLDLALADALSVIATQGPLRMGELADALQVTPASTTRAVSCLAEKGFVDRVKAVDDHRSIMVSVTESGQERFDRFNTRIQAGLSEILAEFTPEEQEQLADYLERFVASVDRYVDRQTPTGAP